MLFFFCIFQVVLTVFLLTILSFKMLFQMVCTNCLVLSCYCRTLSLDFSKHQPKIWQFIFHQFFAEATWELSMHPSSLQSSSCVLFYDVIFPVKKCGSFHIKTWYSRSIWQLRYFPLFLVSPILQELSFHQLCHCANSVCNDVRTFIRQIITPSFDTIFNFIS